MTRLPAILLVWMITAPAFGATLDAKSLRSFGEYDSKVAGQLTQRFKAGNMVSLRDRLSRNSAEPIVASGSEPNPDDIGHAYIHDWVGAIFVPGGTAAGVEAVLKDFNRHKEYFQPEVIGSELLSNQDGEYRNRLRLRKHKIITVILNTEYSTRFWKPAEGKGYSIARSTKIAEVENPGEPDEKELPVGEGQGFLWRLNSYWSWEERDGGVYIECRAISLSRDVPMGLGWMINPIVRSLPRESLENTLKATRTVVRRAASQ